MNKFTRLLASLAVMIIALSCKMEYNNNESAGEQHVEDADLERLIEEGNAGAIHAQMAIGDLFYKRGNRREALMWYEKAAEQGHHGAMYNIAHTLLFGSDADQERSILLLEMLAENGHVNSQAILASCYKTGHAVPRDVVKAYKWYSIARRGGDELASREMVKLERQMSQPQLEQAQLELAAFLVRPSRGVVPAGRSE